MIPFLELSKSLAKRGHHISFLSTPRNILRLPKLPPTLPPLIDFIPIHLPPSDDLADNAEATIDLLPADVEHLKKAYDGLHQPIARFLEQASPRPDWIVQDFVPHWLSPIAAELHIPCAMLNLFPAYFNAFIYGPDGVGMRRSAEQLIVAPEWIPFPTAAAYRLFEARQFHYFLQDDSSGLSAAYRFGLVVRRCKFMALRGCMEWD
ncbi:putative UDP-rhamnose:rhamnosyltransferase 1 [Cocos nucifera]|uniref:Putative UDP-rhamnose:rhamnosyltransferase 1 n=1 Tax=Cocos nucifera TaxID=13894 RepID=A0A8K0IQA5_COCNU|nr:putative UDP-rhamnose:rhamnosyltransferase 1 [Cocos nucifera]